MWVSKNNVNTCTIIHVLISCEKIHTVWGELSLYLYRETSERVGLNLSNIILGQLQLSFHNKVINFIFLYLKQNIFCSPLSNKIRCLIDFLRHLNLKHNIERYSAIQSC